MCLFNISLSFHNSWDIQLIVLAGYVSYPVHNGEKILDELVDMKRQRDIELLVVLTHIQSLYPT